MVHPYETIRVVSYVIKKIIDGETALKALAVIAVGKATTRLNVLSPLAVLTGLTAIPSVMMSYQ